MRKSVVFILIGSLIFFTFQASGQLKYEGQRLSGFGDQVGYYIDEEGGLGWQEVLTIDQFQQNLSEIPNLGITNKSHWMKFSVETGRQDGLILDVAYPILDHISFYLLDDENNFIDSTRLGELYAFGNRHIQHQNFTFDLKSADYDQVNVLVNIRSGEQIVAPLRIDRQESLRESYFTEDLLFGIYTGIVLVMILYNSFIYFSTRDKSYLWYILCTRKLLQI